MSGFHDLIDAKEMQNPQSAKDQRISLISEIEKATGRPLVVYAAAIANKPPQAPAQIDLTDKTAFSDLLDGIPGDRIDIFLHSPGGVAEAAEQVVTLIRSRFCHVRYIVPHTATSAATLMVLSGDSVAMDDRSTLGPIDPQIVIPMQNGQIRIPAHSYVQGFLKAKESIEENPDTAAAYLPLLSKYDLYLLEICQNALNLSRSLAEEWLRTYMLKDHHDRDQLAASISVELSDHAKYLSHQRPIGIQRAKELGLVVTDLRDHPELRESLWRLYCMVEFHLDRSPAVKLFENSRGVSYQRLFVVKEIQLPLMPQMLRGQPAAPPQP
jgi:ATP-dependent protease ClpP protease subunit